MRQLLGFICGFLLVFGSCFILTGCNVDIAPAATASSAAGPARLEMGNDTIYIPWSILDDFNKMYIENNDTTEKAFCLTGEKNKIDGWYPGETIYSDLTHSELKCGLKDIGFIHTHPEHSCRLSTTDIAMTEENFSVCVICDINKISCYKDNNLMKINKIEMNKSFTDITLLSSKTEVLQCVKCFKGCYEPCDVGYTFLCDSNTKEGYCTEN